MYSKCCDFATEKNPKMHREKNKNLTEFVKNKAAMGREETIQDLK